VIYCGIDDTDMPETRGTNQLARILVSAVARRYRCLRIVRHQLCGHPSIPCTSKNGSASMIFEPRETLDLPWLIDTLRAVMLENFTPGSDPGLCVAREVPASITEFAWRTKERIVDQAEARKLAADAGIHLEGLGGTEGGVIGALAAVGLAVTGDDGRVVQLEDWPDDLMGVVDVRLITARGVTIEREHDRHAVVEGMIDLEKKLRPNLRKGRIVLSARPGRTPDEWVAMKLL
jgi:hypothetical protein